MRDQNIVASAASASADEPRSNTEPNTEPTPTPKDPYLICLKKDPEDNGDTSIATLPIGVTEAAKRRAEESLALAKKKKIDNQRWRLCLTCDEPFSADDLLKHQATCVKKQAELVDFKCNKCNKVFPREESLKKHHKSVHEKVGNAKPNRVETKKYKCALCKDVMHSLYKHYGIKHLIEKMEQILFVNGRVLVFSDINTEDGDAAWFKEQLEKAKGRYKGAVCRLCDVDLEYTDLLKAHYTEHHKVDSDSLNVVELLFRSEIGAHLRESPETRDKKRKRGDTCILYRCKCGETADRYDAAVEHSQEHLVAKHTGTQMGVARNIAFVSMFKVIDYDFETLLTERWIDIFNSIPRDKDRILSSSLYKFSRSVRFYLEHCESTNGIAVYKCEKCQVIFEPEMIENHCKNYYNCANQKPIGNYCNKCNARLNSANALAHHKRKHAVGVRLVTFNNKNDAQINKVLEMLINRSDDLQEDYIEVEVKPIKHEEAKPIEIKDVELYCKQCRQWMDASIIEAHTAEHQQVKDVKPTVLEY